MLSRIVTTFPDLAEFEKARKSLDGLGLSYDVIRPEPAYVHVGVPGLAVEPEARILLAAKGLDQFTCSGWVGFRPGSRSVPREPPPEFREEVFGQARIMVLAPCVADPEKIRFVAHISGNLTEAMPYLNAVMRGASYNPRGPTLTYMEGYRFIVLYARRITVAKADDLVDAWRVMELIRREVNEVWARRGDIEPSFETREKPPVLEIYKRLPGTNCGACGQKTCLAFAVSVYMGQAGVSRCSPVFEGQFSHLKGALVEICAGLGVFDAEADNVGEMGGRGQE